METKGLDVVYVVRPGENEELRYSLRSLKNLDFSGKVWIYGEAPSWVSGCEVIRHRQTGIGKWNRTRSSLVQVARNKQISDNFILLNDDMFIWKKTDYIPYMTRGALKEFMQKPRFRNGFGKLNGYGQRLATTEKYVPGAMNYEVHVPMVFNRARLNHLYQKFQFGATRSLYGNYYKLEASDGEDVKIYDLVSTPPRGASFVSTTDISFRDGKVGESIRRKFKEVSRYEAIG